MSVDLSDFVDSLRREVTPAGTTMFDDVSDATMTGYLADAFWEARLDGFLLGYSADPDGMVTPVNSGSPDMPRSMVALLVLYAGMRILRNRILNTTTSLRAKAGPVEFEQQNSATMLAEMLRQLAATKTRLIDNSLMFQTEVSMVDGLSVRDRSFVSYYGGYQLTDGLY